ncbi:hypothetical protein [Siccibacter turicensis]|uniref:hypothetical protein n=1 Tax=Siccibacter turicensis TaxID=357233 RepID=UPI001020CD8E|nr:hypothetical protein [Siccibacter turicensis]
MADYLTQRDKMENSDILNELIEEVKILQRRVGATEYLIQLLSNNFPDEELQKIARKLNHNILDYGENSEIGKIMIEGLRILGQKG